MAVGICEVRGGVKMTGFADVLYRRSRIMWIYLIRYYYGHTIIVRWASVQFELVGVAAAIRAAS